MKIPENIWKICIENNPIFAIDLVIHNKKYGMLTGKRINEPAKGKYFVPGGRIFKNETREDAFERIAKSETGLDLKFIDSKPIGIFEHFYQNSKWEEEDIKTHYIIEARYISINSKIEKFINLDNQHNDFLWLNNSARHKLLIHKYCEPYLNFIYK